MKKRNYFYFICGILIVLTGIYNLWIFYHQDHANTFIISTGEMISLFITRPIFWFCIGVEIAYLFLKKIGSVRLAKLSFTTGLAFIVVYIIMLMMYQVRILEKFNMIYSSLIFISKYMFLFLIPGILIGWGIGFCGKQ